MLCQNCNKDITVESKFCRYCGSAQTPVQQAPVAPPPVPVQQAPVAPPPAPVQQAPVAPPPVPAQQAPVAPTPPPVPVQQAPIDPMAGGATPPGQVQAPADFSATVGNVVSTAGAGLKDAMNTVVDKTKDTVATINADGTMSQKLKSPMMKKYFIIGGGALAAVIIIVLIITLVVMNSPTAVVGRALNNTIGDMESEIENITNEIPAILFFEDFQKDEYDMDISYSDGFQDLSINVQSDFGSEKIRAEVVSVLGIGGEIMISDKYGTIALDSAIADMVGLSDVYGWDNETIATDLYNAGLIDVENAEDINLNIFEDHTASYEKINKMLQDCFTDIFKEADIEAIDKEEMTINGEDINAKGYVIVLDSEVIEERIAEFLDDVFESEDLVDAYIPYASAMNMGSMDVEEIKEELMYSVTSMLGGMRELEVEVFVHKNRIVSLRSESAGYPMRFDLNPDGDVLEYVAAISEGEEVMVFGAIMEDDELIVSYKETYGESLVMVYDLESDRNNVEISTDNDDYVFTVYSEDKNNLLIEAEMDGESLRIEATKGGLSGDWFDQPENYTDITELLSLGLLGF